MPKTYTRLIEEQQYQIYGKEPEQRSHRKIPQI
jgi:hypothetical protein